jgi:hypothetical protein
MTINPGTKTYKLFSALSNGERISASQAAKRFGIKNMSVLKSAVFVKWFCCVRKHTPSRQRRQVTEYRIGSSKPQIGCRWLPSHGTWFGLNQLAVLIKQNTHDKNPATCRVFS